MKRILVTLVLTLTALSANAQSFNPEALKVLQQQLSSSPAGQQATQAAQEMLVQKALQQVAANPQLLTSMMNRLSPEQQATLMQQAMVAGQQIFTQKEQAKLMQFAASPEGSSITQKMPQLVQALAPTVLQMVAAQQAGAGVMPAAGK